MWTEAFFSYPLIIIFQLSNTGFRIIRQIKAFFDSHVFSPVCFYEDSYDSMSSSYVQGYQCLLRETA